MKILIAYSSKTGNTKKVAYAIKEELCEAVISDVSEIENIDFDLIFLGGWIDKSTLDKKALNFAQKLFNKNVAYFYTLGAYPTSDHAKTCTKNIETLLKQNGNNIVNSYLCQGAIDPKLIEMLLKLPSEHPRSPNEERKKRWEDAKSHPNKDDLQKAKEFALSSKIAVIKDLK